MKRNIETRVKKTALIGRRKVYVASSWRNTIQPVVVESIAGLGHEVYDFKNGDNPFHWSSIHPDWQLWDANQYSEALTHPIAEAGFKNDYDAMKWADTFVLVQPCGRSAHLEMGWACGAGKETIMMLGNAMEPELMVKMCDHICIGLAQLLDLFEVFN